MSKGFPKEQVDLVQAVYDMRKAQKRYFKEQNQYNLKVCKVKEQRVDQLIQPYITAGVVTDAISATYKSNSLFNNG